MPDTNKNLDTAILAVQALGALALAGGNVVMAAQEISLLLQQKHLKGETLSRDDLLALMERGDIAEAAVFAKLKEALANP